MGPIGQNFQILSSVDSTNNYAMAQLQKGAAQHGDAWFALEQTAGKGQRHKKWITLPGQNLVLSVVLAPGVLLAGSQFSLSMAVALGCYDLLETLVPEKISIKWPNDLYWSDRKAGGILIENLLRGSDWLSAIAGIGINVNQVQFPEEVRNPVSLKQLLGRHLDPVQLAHQLCEYLEIRYSQLQHGDADTIWQQYNAALYRRGETVRLRRGNILFEAKIVGVDRQGLLLVETGVPEQFQVGEVEWVL